MVFSHHVWSVAGASVRLTSPARCVCLWFDYPVDEAVFNRFFRTHEEISLRVPFDAIKRFARVRSQDLVQLLPNLDNLSGVDFDVGSLTSNPSHRLVEQNP